MKKAMVWMGIATASMIGAGVMIYSFVLCPQTKKKLMSLEKDMCEDLECMMEK